MIEITNFTASHSEFLHNITAAAQFVKPFREEFFLAVKVLAPFWPAIISFGLCSNIVNIVVFLKAGAKDNVTILFLSLAISDLVFLTIISPHVFRHFIYALVPSFSWPFAPIFLVALPYWPAYTAYDLSTFISVSLGVMRCACVAMPLKFKLVFTRSRTIKWVFFLVVLAVSLRVPVLSVYRIIWRTDPKTNVSSLFLGSANYDSMIRINDIVNRGFVIYASYTTMVTCVIILIFKLNQAANMRRLITTGKSETMDQSSDQGLSGKDLQVIKSVVLVCSVFVVLQFPFLVVSTARLISSELDNDTGSNTNRLSFLFGILARVNATCSYLNASVNIFIYYKYNSKYRSVLQELLCLTKGCMRKKSTN